MKLKLVLGLLATCYLHGGFIQAQELLKRQNSFGVSAGLQVALGTHVNRVGLTAHFFYTNNNLQLNSAVRIYHNFKNLGPKGGHPELVLSQGIVYGYGKRNPRFNPFINSVSNQTGFLNAFAYSYNAYFNAKKTTQQTGIVCIEVNRLSLITENDLLARGYYDRFRTAAFLLQYQYEDLWQAALNCTMWTGQYRRKSENTNAAFYNGCYMDTLNGIYTSSSHGLLSAQFKYNAPFANNLQANIGVDAEQVRNVMQNKFIHDMRFIPKKWNKSKNCHIPMLDEAHRPYLYQSHQRIRKPLLFLNLYSNPNLFY